MGVKRVTLVIALSCMLASPSWADQLELRDGRVLDGTVLALGESRLAFDGPEGVVVLARSQVVRVVDGAGQPLTSQGQADPVAVVKVVGVGVTVRRLDQDLALSVHGEASVVREGDLIRTLPQGRVALAVEGGGVVTARSDALVRFQQGVPHLLEGVLNLEHGDGLVRAQVPEGRIEVREGRAVLERLNDRTHVRCLAGRTELRAQGGYRVVVPRNHALDVEGGTAERLGTLIASNANAWPLRLESQGRFVSIQPGERIVLMGTLRAPEPEPEPEPEARDEPAPELLADAEPDSVDPSEPPSEAGRVVRATGSFGLVRVGQPDRQVDQVEAQDLALWQGDALRTDQGQVELEVAGTRARLLPRSALAIARHQGGAPLALDGEATFETSGAVAVALPMGELGLLRGALAVRASRDETELNLRQGIVGVRLGDAVRVELLRGATLRAVSRGERVEVEAPVGGLSLGVSLGSCDLQLDAGRRVSHGATGGVQQLGFWNQATVELVGPVRLRVVPGPEESSFLLLADGRHYQLVDGGSYRFTQEGDEVRAAQLPPGVEAREQPELPLEALAQAQPEAAQPEAAQPEAAQPEAAQPEPAQPEPVTPGTQRVTLPNGAVVVARDWGPVQVGRQAEGRVEVTLPCGRAWLGPSTELRLSKSSAGVRVETADGRYLVHEPSGEPIELYLEADATLRVEIGVGASRRAVQVEPGCQFDVLIRGSYARAYVFGQVKYVEPGELVRVGQTTGLRSHFARERTER